MKTFHILVAAVIATGAAASFPAAAQAPAAAQPAAADAAALTQGEVRKIDHEAGKITLRHGTIKNLDMPPMTMVFRVRDPALLKDVHVGDKVLFAAVADGGKLVVTQLQSSR